jgi:hypothetical protein
MMHELIALREEYRAARVKAADAVAAQHVQLVRLRAVGKAFAHGTSGKVGIVFEAYPKGSQALYSKYAMEPGEVPVHVEIGDALFAAESATASAANDLVGALNRANAAFERWVKE